MARYQFDPRGLLTLDKVKARAAATKHGARHIRECFPDMKDTSGKRWRGTNQPRTIAFTATPEQAVVIGAEYGEASAFVWSVDNGGHYI